MGKDPTYGFNNVSKQQSRVEEKRTFRFATYRQDLSSQERHSLRILRKYKVFV